MYLPHCLAGTTQRGAALIVMLVVMVIGFTALLVNSFSLAGLNNQRQTKTASALAQAKEALIGYAASVKFTGGAERPGDLPCPDTNNDGTAEASCGNASGSTGQNLRLGRLPWKTLGLPDLRDGSGERLWYAASNNFKKSTRTSMLNSDTLGTITIRGTAGAILNDGTNPDPFNPSGVIAVVIAPGEVLQRQGAAAPQNRDTAGSNIPANYLDTGYNEDNAAFSDGTNDGFIEGNIKDANGNLIVNDRLIAITYQDLLPLLEKRVLREAYACLASYAGDPQNNGRYPWAALMSQSASGNYSDVTDQRFGRIPNDFGNTLISSNNAMKNGWTADCNLNLGSWWNNWRELVLYGLADAYKPVNPLTLPSCGNCLTVNPPSMSGDKQFVLLMSGKRLAAVNGGQPRSTAATKSLPANYWEGDNDPTAALPAQADSYTQQSDSATFNDRILFK